MFLMFHVGVFTAVGSEMVNCAFRLNQLLNFSLFQIYNLVLAFDLRFPTA